MWPLFLALLVVSTATEDCSVNQQFGIHLRPNDSVKNGAEFVAYSMVENADQCHSGKFCYFWHFGKCHIIYFCTV